MSKKSHSAPGPGAGYGYQFERALYWLAKSPAGASIGIETDDDVAVRNGSVSMLEQDKHSIVPGAEPFGDRSKDLWNTLSIWTDAVEENRIDVENARFLMVTNKALPAGLARAIGTAVSAPDINACIDGLERAAENPPDKIRSLVGKVLRSESRDALINIMQRSELVDATDGASAAQVKKDTIASLQLPSWAIPTGDSILHELTGWVHANTMTAWRENKPAWIARDHFVNQLHALLDNRKRKIARERAEYLIPVSKDDIVQRKGRPFVKQLFLITEDGVLVDTAIGEFIRCGLEKLRLSGEGNITDDDWRAFDTSLKTRFDKIRGRVIRTRDKEPSDKVGFEIFVETTESHRERLAGLETEQVYLTSGTYHRMADVLDIGWHPDYENLMNGDGEDA